MCRAALSASLIFSLLSSAALQGQMTGSLRVTVPSPNAASLGRYGDIPVSLYTGVPDVSVPLFTLKGRTLSLPITLRYHASGVRVEDIASWVGLGWTLDAGGVITRTVRGNADDKNVGYYYTGNTWYDNANWPTLTNGNVGTQVQNGTIDGDPDLFFFSFAGRSGQFVMGPVSTGGAIEYRAIPSQKLRIIPTFTSGAISSFAITTEDGTRYTFSGQETHWDYTFGTSSGGGELIASSWYLTQITSPGGDTFTLYYSSYQARHRMGWYHEEISVINPANCATPLTDLTNEYLINTERLDSIKGAAYTAHFVQGATLRSDALNPIGQAQQEPLLDKVTITTPTGKLVRVFQLGHSYFAGNRLRLDNVAEQDSAGNSLPPYTFTYDGQTLPDRASFAQDHWGYYNGKTTNTTYLPTLIWHQGFPGGTNVVFPGADRTPVGSYMQAGVLTRITYPTGGYTNFTYEPNDYGIVADGTPLTQNVAHTANVSASPFQGLHTTTMTIGGTGTVAVHVAISMYAHTTISGCVNGDPNTPCPWGEIVGVGKWYPGIPPFTGGSNYNFGTDLALAPGTYTLQTSAASLNDDISISANWNELVLVTKKIAGGLRVNEIDTYEPTSATTTTHKYVYTLQSDPNTSSGIIGAEPKYDFEYDGTCAFYSRASASKIPLGSGSIGEVAYREVTVLDGANGEFGKARHVFRSMAEWPDDHNLAWPGAMRTSNAWERGQTKETDEYNAAGVMQRLVTSTYGLDGLGPVSARRFRAMSLYHHNWGNAMAYTFYNAYEVVAGWIYQSGETSTQYDTTGTSSIASTKTFVYGNPNHLQLTEIDETNSDGTQRITRMKYPGDYATGSGNPEAAALTAMQDVSPTGAHMPGVVIERSVSVKTGASDRVVQAEITTFKQFAAGQYLPYQHFVLSSPSPIP
jgi:hypothetical protein